MKPYMVVVGAKRINVYEAFRMVPDRIDTLRETYFHSSVITVPQSLSQTPHKEKSVNGL